MEHPKSLLERAFELARTGDYDGVSGVRAQLKAEGYSQLESQLSGLSLRRQIKRLCAEAIEAKGGGSEG